MPPRVKRILLSRDDIEKLKGLGGKERKGHWRELAQKRRRLIYGANWKPSAELLEIAPKQERDAAFGRGKMIFYSGNGKGKQIMAFDIKKCVEKDDTFKTYRLIMPIRVGGKTYAVRYSESESRFYLFGVKDNAEAEVQPRQFVSCMADDMGHIMMPTLKRRNIILPIMRIATQHAVALYGTAVARVFLHRFEELFSRLGYRTVVTEKIPPLELASILSAAKWINEYGGDYQKAGVMLEKKVMRFDGRPNELNNLNKNYRFVALDPETGKMKSYYYPISPAP